jgi:hypothetical protein
VSEEYIITSLGSRPTSAVRVVQDGAFADATADQSLSEKAADNNLDNDLSGPSVLLAEDRTGTGSIDGWIALAEWDNPGGALRPVVSFATTWSVPPGPPQETAQVICLWNGLANDKWLLQAVLQWGAGGQTGGGEYWSVSSRFVSTDSGAPLFTSKLVKVNPGDVLTGRITLTGTKEKFSYRCEFLALPDTVLNVRTTPHLSRCFEVLEAHDIALCTNYPAACATAMADIDLQVAGSTGPVHPPVTWEPSTLVDNCGQHVAVVSDSSREGRIDLHYRESTPLPTLAHVATSLRTGPIQTDVYLASTQGAVAMMWIGQTGGWQGPLPLTRAGIMPGGGTVVGSSRAGVANRTDVHFADNNGAISEMSVQGAGYWRGPQPVTAPSVVPPGAAVAVRPRLGIPGRTDMYYADVSGAVDVTWAFGSGSWNGPVHLTGPGVVPAGAPITVSPQYGVDGCTDLFFIGRDGALNVLWVIGDGEWNGPVPLTLPGVAPPGTRIAASAHYGIPDQTDVFFVDQTGSVVAFWIVGRGNWQGPLALTVADIAPPGATVAATQHQGAADQTDVFFIDRKGIVNVLWVVGSGQWSPRPLALTKAIAVPGGRLTAGPRYGAGVTTDVAFVDSRGRMNVLSAAGAHPWMGPTVISC